MQTSTRAQVRSELERLIPAIAVEPAVVDEFVALVLDLPASERARRITARLRESRRMLAWYGLHRNLAVTQLRDGGATYADVARVTGLSPSRAQQLCRRLEAGAATAQDPSTPAQVAREVLAFVPPDEGTPWFYESLISMVTTGTPAERAAAITARVAVATAVVTWLSGHRDAALLELRTGGSGSSQIARSLGLSPAWTTTLLRRLDHERAAGRVRT